MHPSLLLIFAALALGASVAQAQEQAAAVPVAQAADSSTDPGPAVPPEETVSSPDKPAADADAPPTAAANEPDADVPAEAGAGDAEAGAANHTGGHETPDTPAPVDQASNAGAAPVPDPTGAVAGATADDPAEATASAPATETAPPPETAPVVVPNPAPAPAQAPTPPANTDSHAELFAASVSLMEQLFRAQHEREVSMYRDTIRLVTIFGGSFAALCMIGLLGAAFFNYRALVAVQNLYARTQAGAAALPPLGNGMLAAPAAAVPGMERVQASGQRFQSRMSGLEQRLAELEHLAGRETPPGEAARPATADPEVIPSVTDSAGTAGLAPPPTQVIPRAMILVHKAQTLANLGKFSDALATLDEASSFDAAKTEVHLARGQVLEKLGRLGDALKAYDTAVDVDDHNTSALLLKAGVLNRQERFSEALACYERALEVHRAAV